MSFIINFIIFFFEYFIYCIFVEDCGFWGIKIFLGIVKFIEIIFSEGNFILLESVDINRVYLELEGNWWICLISYFIILMWFFLNVVIRIDIFLLFWLLIFVL